MEGIPLLLMKAVNEAAWIEYNTPNSLNKKQDVGIKKIKVGSIEKEYANGTDVSTVSYPVIEAYLKRLLVRYDSGSLKVVRV